VDGEAHLLAVGQVGLRQHMVSAGLSVGACAVHPCRVVPGQGHLPHPGLVEPPGGIVIGHGIALQGIHVLLDPAVGKPEGLAVVVVPVEVDIHIAVVEAQAVNVVRQGCLLPDAAVGHADLHPADGPLRQHRPLQGHLDAQAAVLGVGGHVHIIGLDAVQVLGIGRRHRRQGQHQAEAQQHPAQNFPHGQHPPSCCN